MMTGKRESEDKDWHAGRSEPNLGQKAAELEKGSEAALRHMEGVHATSAPGRFIAWCKQEQASLEQELELLISGKVRTGEDMIERAKARLAELNDLLTEAGSATVARPGDL